MIVHGAEFRGFVPTWRIDDGCIWRQERLAEDSEDIRIYIYSRGLSKGARMIRLPSPLPFVAHEAVASINQYH
jgi:hypothetical protein